MALLILDKHQEEKEPPSCISTCIREHDFECSGRIWSPKREEKSNYCSLFELIKCLCLCHENDSVPLSYEQKKWLSNRIRLPMGIPFKTWSNVE